LRLSHSSSIRRRRSSGLRSPMFRAGLLIDAICHVYSFSATVHPAIVWLTIRLRRHPRERNEGQRKRDILLFP
jgi:hypothetical protein